MYYNLTFLLLCQAVEEEDAMSPEQLAIKNVGKQVCIDSCHFLSGHVHCCKLHAMFRGLKAVFVLITVSIVTQKTQNVLQ